MTNLTPELTALASTAVLTSIMWIPIILNRLKEDGIWPALSNPQPDVRPMANWSYRLGNAHRNALENLMIFAPLVLIVHVMGIGNGVTAMAASVFFLSRIAHAVIYTLGIPLFRTVAFAIGFGCEILLALRIFGIV